MRINRIIIIFLLLFTQILFVSIALAKEAEVTVVDIEGLGHHEAEKIKMACELLGVRLKTHYVGRINDRDKLKSSKELEDKEVLILTGRALKYLNEDVVSVLGKRDRKRKILILGISPETDVEDVTSWSENGIKRCRQFDLLRLGISIRVTKNDGISRELVGLEYPLMGSGSEKVDGFELANFPGAVSLAEVVDESGKPVCPVFVKTESSKRSVFLLTSWEEVIPVEANSLLKILPILMFLKYSFGDRSWHAVNDYANLTIDDPWLRDPYGYIRFADLWREAKRARFHVTLGFIPYDYRRSHDDVVEIFRQCPQDLSVAMHGNSHDLSEFRFGGNERLTDKKFSGIHPDEKNILQALYRMDTFSCKTGLSFDRVMIFPRGVFTKESMELLKKHNFLMTVNSTSPLEARDMRNIVDQMRGITLEYKNFPMVLRSGISDWKKDRHAAAIAKSWIQMRLFLDLPVLLYTHHGFFKDGADAFNPIAVMINKVQPEVVWSGLGNIAKKLYLQKRIDDREMDVLAFSSDLVIKNNYSVPIKYVVRKQEDFLIPIESVEVDGVKHEYLQDGNYIRVEVLIDPGREKKIRILYHSDYQVGSFTYSDNNLQATLVRALSDFRDLYLSKLPFGDKVVMIFYWIGGVKNVVICLLGVAGIFSLLMVLHIKNRKSKKKVLLV